MEETVSRLEVLQRVNPAIRERDIAAAKKERDAVLAAIAAARVRLDALRLVAKGKMA